MEHSKFTDYPPLNEAIIPLHFVPIVEPPKDQELIPVTITGPAELTQGERSINIKTQLLAYNALLLCRDRPVANGELRSFNLGLSGPTLRDHLEILSGKLSELTGEDILDRQGSGRWRTYMLSPRLQLTDERAKIDSSLRTKLQRLAISYPENLTDFDPSQPVTFKDVPTRQRALAMVIRDYSALPETRKALRPFHALPGFAPDRERWKDYPKPSQEECLDLIARIEYGLAAATIYDDPAHDIDVAVEMVTAHHRLYFGHLFMVKSLADQLCRTAQEHSYLFEIGSTELLKAVMNYKIIMPDGSEGGTFASLAYETIKQSMRRYKLFDGEGPYNLPKSSIEMRASVVKAIDDYIAKYRRTPANREIAHELELTADQVKTALNFTYMSEDIEDFYDSAQVEDIDRFENDLSSYTAETEIHAMFCETDHPDSLSDREKVVLSLRYAIFVSGLAGMEIRTKKGVVFTYPYTVESLPQFAPAHAQIATMLDSSEMVVNRAEKSALQKARRMLLDWGVEAPEGEYEY